MPKERLPSWWALLVCVELAIAEWPKLSSNQIAEMCGVSQPFVDSRRKALITDINATRTTKDGRQYPAKRKPQPEPEPEEELPSEDYEDEDELEPEPKRVLGPPCRLGCPTIAKRLSGKVKGCPRYPRFPVAVFNL